jgi:nicotinate-nucleotide adenylyltransferase
MENKIVLLFGSFNPVTKAHVETLTKSMNLVGAEKGIFIPTSYDHIYSKMIKTKGRMVLSNELRTKMLQSVCDNDDRLSVCTYEMDNSIINNTKETLEYLIKNNPNSTIYYTCGADKIKSFTKWNNIEYILNNVELIVFNRSDINIDTIINNDSILKKYSNKFNIMNSISESNISSTKIRSMFLEGNDDYKILLPDSVAGIFSQLNPSDYPEMDLSKWIELMHKYGGMHGSDLSLKELYNENKKIIKDMINVDTMFYTSPIVENNIIYDNCEINCVNSNVITEYEKLKLNNFNPVIINVCNRVRACGKYDMGYFKTISDEEELCRISNLSNHLYPYGNPRLNAVRECDVKYKELRYPLNRDNVLYCKDVVVFRNDKNEWYKLLDKKLLCDIILVPSISLREKESAQLLEDLKFKNEDGSLNLEGKQILKESIINSWEVMEYGLFNYFLRVIDEQ